MRRALKHLWTGTRWCTACAFSFVLWTVWLALALLLAVQGYIATHRELEVPGFLLRSLEERLVASGVRATFGRTSFDPTGRVLIENARVSLPAFTEPVIAARAIYVRLDPWALAVGQFNPSELRVSGASFAVPAMLSPSGRSEEILRDLDATLIPHDQQLELAHFSGRVAGISLVAHGAIALPPRNREKTASLPIAEFLARNYSALSRQLIAASQQLTALDQPSLQLRLTPSPTRVALVNLTLLAHGVKLTVPQTVQATGLRVVTRFPLFGDAPINARVELTADSVALPFGADARHVRALVRGTLRPGRLQFVPRELDLAADSLSAAGFSARAVSARLIPGPLPRLTADLVALIQGSPLAFRASTDLAAQTATLRFAGAISPEILTPLSEHLHVDVRKYFDFAFMDRAEGEVRLGPGWKFENLSARVALRGVNAYHVIMEEGRAAFEFDGRHFYAPEAWARIGDNFAHGSFEQDLKTLEYRFLLEGRLRPLAISGWFREWWPNFFNQLEFPVAAPEASVEVSGRWTENRRSFIFVFADSAHPVIRGAAFDRVRTRLVIRPGYFDSPEVLAVHSTGTAQGTFRYTLDPAPATPAHWGALELDLTSTLDPSVAVKMLGPLGESIFSPFKWSAPPSLKLAGRIEGGAHTTLHLEGHTPGEFRFQDFPLTNVTFVADVRDNDVDVTRMDARLGDGTLAGRVKIFGNGRDRRVNFDYALKDISLVRAVSTLQDYTARKNGTPPSPPGKFLQEKAAVHLDLRAAAEGRYDDPLSYHGTGRAMLQGPGLGEVQLLGLLSELLKFTALRFTSAKTTFKIDGAKLTFPDLAIRGANSAIDAHGDFALDRRVLDFKAKLFPFQESGNPLKSLVGVVLTPFSNIFEVKLTGTLDKPQWAFVVGPTSLLRALAPGETPPPTAPPFSPPSTTPPPATATPPTLTPTPPTPAKPGP